MSNDEKVHDSVRIMNRYIDLINTWKEATDQSSTLYRTCLGRLDSIAIMLKKAEAYAQQIDSQRQSLEYQILQNDLAMVRNEKDILKLRRKILRTLRKEPRVVKKYLLFYDAVPKSTKLFGYAIIGTIVILITSPLLTK